MGQEAGAAAASPAGGAEDASSAPRPATLLPEAHQGCWWVYDFAPSEESNPLLQPTDVHGAMIVQAEDEASAIAAAEAAMAAAASTASMQEHALVSWHAAATAAAGGGRSDVAGIAGAPFWCTPLARPHIPPAPRYILNVPRAPSYRGRGRGRGRGTSGPRIYRPAGSAGAFRPVQLPYSNGGPAALLPAAMLRHADADEEAAAGAAVGRAGGGAAGARGVEEVTGGLGRAAGMGLAPMAVDGGYKEDGQRAEHAMQQQQQVPPPQQQQQQVQVPLESGPQRSVRATKATRRPLPIPVPALVNQAPPGAAPSAAAGAAALAAAAALASGAPAIEAAAAPVLPAVAPAAQSAPERTAAVAAPAQAATAGPAAPAAAPPTAAAAAASPAADGAPQQQSAPKVSGAAQSEGVRLRHRRREEAGGEQAVSADRPHKKVKTSPRQQEEKGERLQPQGAEDPKLVSHEKHKMRPGPFLIVPLHLPRELKWCSACGKGVTPMWRRGAGGVVLCNSCGIRYRNTGSVKETPPGVLAVQRMQVLRAYGVSDGQLEELRETAGKLLGDRMPRAGVEGEEAAGGSAEGQQEAAADTKQEEGGAGEGKSEEKAGKQGGEGVALYAALKWPGVGGPVPLVPLSVSEGQLQLVLGGPLFFEPQLVAGGGRAVTGSESWPHQQQQQQQEGQDKRDRPRVKSAKRGAVSTAGARKRQQRQQQDADRQQAVTKAATKLLPLPKVEAGQPLPLPSGTPAAGNPTAAAAAAETAPQAAGATATPAAAAAAAPTPASAGAAAARGATAAAGAAAGALGATGRAKRAASRGVVLVLAAEALPESSSSDYGSSETDEDDDGEEEEEEQVGEEPQEQKALVKRAEQQQKRRQQQQRQAAGVKKGAAGAAEGAKAVSGKAGAAAAAAVPSPEEAAAAARQYVAMAKGRIAARRTMPKPVSVTPPAAVPQAAAAAAAAAVAAVTSAAERSLANKAGANDGPKASTSTATQQVAALQAAGGGVAKRKPQLLKAPTYEIIKSNVRPAAAPSSRRDSGSATAQPPRCSCDPAAGQRCRESDGCVNRLLRLQCIPGVCACGQACENQEVVRGKGPAVAAGWAGEEKGWGVVAKEAIPAGAFVGEYIGEVLPLAVAAEQLARYARQGRQRWFVFDLTPSGGEVVDATRRAGGPVRFINHRWVGRRVYCAVMCVCTGCVDTVGSSGPGG